MNPSSPCLPGTMLMLKSGLDNNLNAGGTSIPDRIPDPTDNNRSILSSDTWSILLPTPSKINASFRDLPYTYKYKSDWHFLFKFSKTKDFTKTQRHHLILGADKADLMPNPATVDTRHTGAEAARANCEYGAGILTWDGSYAHSRPPHLDSATHNNENIASKLGDIYTRDWVDMEEILFNYAFCQPNHTVTLSDNGSEFKTLQGFREFITAAKVTYPFVKSKRIYFTNDPDTGIKAWWENSKESYDPRVLFSDGSSSKIVEFDKTYGPANNRQTHKVKFVALKQYWELDLNGNRPKSGKIPSHLFSPTAETRYRKFQRLHHDTSNFVGNGKIRYAPENYYLYTKIVSRACARGASFANETVLKDFMMSVISERISVLESASRIWGEDILRFGSALTRPAEELFIDQTPEPDAPSGNISPTPAVITPGKVARLFQLYRTERIGDSFVHIRRDKQTGEIIPYRKYVSMMQDPLIQEEERVQTELVPLTFSPLTDKNLGSFKYKNPDPRADDDGRFRGSNALNLEFPEALISYLMEAESWQNRALSDKTLFVELDMTNNPQEIQELAIKKNLTHMARSINLRLLLDTDEDALLEIDNLSDKFRSFPLSTSLANDVFYNSPVLLEMASERINALTTIITDLIQNQQQAGIVYKLLPVISSVFEKIKQCHPSLSDSINCTFNGINTTARQNRSRDIGRTIGMKFAKNPYTPGIQMAEYAITKGNNKDRFNVFIDSDRLLRLGPKMDLIRQKGDSNSDFALQLLEREKEIEELPLRPTAENEFYRQVYHFCEPLTESLISVNETPDHYESYSKASAFGFIVKNKIQKLLIEALRIQTPDGTLTDQQSLDRIEGQLRNTPDSFLRSTASAFSTHAYEKVTEEIFLELTNSLQKSRIFEEEYADDLEDRVSGRPIITESCVANRYSLSESSVLSFEDTILGDAMAEVQAEMMKPENSPFNRDFSKPEPFELAMQTIALKAFIRTCIIDLMLKGAPAYSIWDIEPIVSTQLFKEYVKTHVTSELNRSELLSTVWPKLIKRAMGIENKSAALRSFIEEEIIKLPQYSKQIFNPRTQDKDYFNWHVFGKTIWASDEQETKEKLESIKQKGVDTIQNGIFYRMPVPKYTGHLRPSPHAPESIIDLDDHLGFGEDFEQKFNKNDSNCVYTTQASLSDKIHLSKMPISKLIIEDYVRVSGEVLEFAQNTAPYIQSYVAIHNQEDQETTSHGLVFTFEEYNEMIKSIPAPDRLRILRNSTVKQGTRITLMTNSDAVQFKINPELNYVQSIYDNPETHGVSAAEISRTRIFFNNLYKNSGILGVNEDSEDEVFSHQQSFVEFMLRERMGFSHMRTKDVFPEYRETPNNTKNKLRFMTIPLASFEKELSTDSQSCLGLLTGGFNLTPVSQSESDVNNAIATVEGMKFCSQMLAEQQEFKDVVDHIFPVRRFMSMASIFSTSIIGGFGDQPSLMDSVKSNLAIVAAVAAAPKNKFGSVMDLDQAEFQKKVKEDFPGDPDDPKCFDFPGISGEFFLAFWEELKRLMKYFPSILFRGIANQIDFAYKEMRTHYMNCDIRELSWQGVAWKSPDQKLTNGLKGVSKNGENQNGKYVPIVPSGLVDYGISAYRAVWGDWSPLLKTVSKTMTYAFTGMVPHFDLSGMFSIPCIEYKTEWWKNAKYDFGSHGRYGHPISPFTALALSTLQLPADRKKRKSACAVDEEIGELPTKDCEEN